MNWSPETLSIWVGFDPREAASFAVTCSSIAWCLRMPIRVRGLDLEALRANELSARPLTRIGGQLWDVISDAPQATEHANARFLLPFIAPRPGWALFLDGDILVRDDISVLFEPYDRSKALYCVKHDHRPPETVKMDAQAQQHYTRKNWSSVMLWNLQHPAHERLTLEMANRLPGRDLHRFCWLQDDEIGDLPPEWNWLAGYSPAEMEPKAVHYTSGTPDMPGYENAPFADEWRSTLRRWARG